MTSTSLLFAALLFAAPGVEERAADSLKTCDGARPSAACVSFDTRAETSSEESLLTDAADGQLDDFRLLEAMLIAGGHHGRRELESIAGEINRRLADLLSAPLPDCGRQRADRLLTRLHAEMLIGGYRVGSSDVAAVLETGNYNCVSATVLYICLLRKAGVEAHAYAQPGHVYCRIGSDHIEVQTTCARWFELSGREAENARRRVTPGRRRHRGKGRKLSDVQLVAKLYYNRGVACFREGDFDRGLRLTRRSLKLDPRDEVARGNILAGLNNWALSLCREENFAAAAEALDELKRLEPDYPTLPENEAHLYRLWGKKQLEQARSAGAELDDRRG